MRSWSRGIRGFAFVTWSLLLTPVAATAQATVRGHVREKVTSTPIAGARVIIVGTTASTRTNKEGRYTLKVPAGGDSVRIRALAVGYVSEARTIARSELSDSTDVDFDLTLAVVTLEQLVVTATGEQTLMEIGNAIDVLEADSVAATAPIYNLTDLLNSRIPGLTVETNTGTIGGGSRIRIRGSNSISLSNNPVILIDGVRINSSALTGIDPGGQGISRLNDFNPDDFESVEVIKGPSATTLYGTEAANGVISIRTKRGNVGRPTWNFFAGAGVINDRNEYPANYNAYGSFFGGPSENYCFLGYVGLGYCTQDSVVSFNPLKNSVTSPLATGYSRLTGFNVSGGSEQLRYYVGTEFSGQAGTFRIPTAEQDSMKLARGVSDLPRDQIYPNGARRASLRTNLTAAIARNVEADVNLGYVQDRVRLPQNDNNIFGVLGNALLGGYTADSPWLAFSPAASFSHQNDQLINRLTGSVAARWTPSTSITTRLTAGLDNTNETDREVARVGEAPDFLTDAIGTRSINKFTISVYSLDGAVTLNRQLSPTVRSKTTVGGQYYSSRGNGNFATGNGIAAGSNSIDGAAQYLAGSQSFVNSNGGLYVEQMGAFREKLFVIGGLRADKASAFARSRGFLYLPKLAVSYVMVDRPGANTSLFRLRGAYGQSLVAPGGLAARKTFVPVTGVREEGTVAAVTFGSFGNPDLKPERSREFELGLDGSFLGNRLSLELTFYNKLTEDALVSRPIAPSVGGSTVQFVNIGSMSNRGLELGLTTQLLRRENLAFDLAITGSLLRNRVRELGAGIEPFGIGFAQRMVEGYSAAGYWDQIPIYQDANGDGIIGFDEVSISDTAVFLGPSTPTRELTVTPTLSLFRGRLRIMSQWDYRGGHYLDNSTESFRCTFLANCRALYDRNASLEEQAYASAAILYGAFRGKVEKADFLKLRELAVTYTMSRGMARLFRASNGSLTLAGRNLLTWTKYKGLDPETSAFGADNFATSDFLTLPPLQTWSVRVNLGY